MIKEEKCDKKLKDVLLKENDVKVISFKVNKVIKKQKKDILTKIIK